MTDERSGSTPPHPDQVDHFQRLYAAALEAVGNSETEPDTNDLTWLREQLLNRPVAEPEELSRTRQELLDDPEKLKAFFGVFSRHDAALRSLEQSGSITVP